MTPRQAAYRRELKAKQMLVNPTTPPADRQKAMKIVREAAQVRDEKRQERQAQIRANHASRGGRSGELAAIETFLAKQAEAKGHDSLAPSGDGRAATRRSHMRRGLRGRTSSRAGTKAEQARS